MKSDVIANKIESVRRCVTRIEQVTPATVEALMDHIDAQDILCLNLERAVQMTVDIAAHVLAATESKVPDTMADSFRLLDKAGVITTEVSEVMIKAVGFRNIAVHAYRDIDWAIVHAIARKAPSDFREYVRQVMAFIDRSPLP